MTAGIRPTKVWATSEITPGTQVTSQLLAPLVSTPQMCAVFDDAARIRAMTAFEAALAEAESETGVIPADAARSIGEACANFVPDLEALGRAARQQATPAIPFVKALTAHCPEPARGWLHWGATSQDVVDTALVLQLREAMTLLETDIAGLGEALVARAGQHRLTAMAGRTLLQPALPITFGFKCAGWLDAVSDSRAALAAAADQALVLQFGGAVGTLAALGPAATQVRAALGRSLGLPVPDMAWHTARGRLVRLCGELTILCGTLAKIAGDIALLMQAEIAEAAEPAATGRGGSSTMPHKRNPVAAAAVRAAALRANGLMSTLYNAMPHEHERGVGGWHAEWETVPGLFMLTAGALSHVRETIEGLEVDAGHMHANLDISGGAMMAESLAMALAPHIGRAAAHDLVGELVRRSAASGSSLVQIASRDDRVTDRLDAASIAEALDPAGYLGIAETGIDAVLARWESVANATKRRS
jgi:3-carboxy-cis,cis-muconate cycloisomerase